MIQNIFTTENDTILTYYVFTIRELLPENRTILVRITQLLCQSQIKQLLDNFIHRTQYAPTLFRRIDLLVIKICVLAAHIVEHVPDALISVGRAPHRPVSRLVQLVHQLHKDADSRVRIGCGVVHLSWCQRVCVPVATAYLSIRYSLKWSRLPIKNVAYDTRGCKGESNDNVCLPVCCMTMAVCFYVTFYSLNGRLFMIIFITGK